MLLTYSYITNHLLIPIRFLKIMDFTMFHFVSFDTCFQWLQTPIPNVFVCLFVWSVGWLFVCLFVWSPLFCPVLLKSPKQADRSWTQLSYLPRLHRIKVSFALIVQQDRLSMKVVCVAWGSDAGGRVR